MIGVAVKGTEKVAARLAQLAEDGRRESEVAMRKATLVVQRALALEMTAPEARDSFWGKVGAKGLGLSVRSGKTRASLTPGTRVFRTGTLLTGVVGSSEKHLRLHEDGGIISGTSPKGYLRIPTAAAQTSAGVDRYAGRSIRDIPGAFLMKAKSGNLWAALRRGKEVVLLYLLKKQVRMKPRRIFARTAQGTKLAVLELTHNSVSAVVRKANA